MTTQTFAKKLEFKPNEKKTPKTNSQHATSNYRQVSPALYRHLGNGYLLSTAENRTRLDLATYRHDTPPVQRKRACGGSPESAGECVQCHSKLDSAEIPLPGQELPPDIDLAQVPLSSPIPSESTVDVGEKKPKPCCQVESFTKSNDTYTDTATDTRKNIKFTFKVKSGSDPKKCVMVNWIKGTAKNKDGTFRKVKMFNNVVNYNFPTMRIDSLDTDPIYWSNSSGRWNYQSAGAHTYYATDSPGPTTWVDGIDYDLKFKMCLYCIDDVSTTSDEAGSGVKYPLQCIDWVFKAKYDASSSTFTH